MQIESSATWLSGHLDPVIAWFKAAVWEPHVAVQAVAIVVCVLLGLLAKRLLHRSFPEIATTAPAAAPLLHRLRARFWDSLAAFSCLLLLALAQLIASKTRVPYGLLYLGANLLSAWLAIHLASVLISSRLLGRLLAVMAWTLATLNILGLLKPVVETLDRLAIDIGAGHISIFSLGKGLLVFYLLARLGHALTQLLGRRLRQYPDLSPSQRELLGKMAQIAALCIALLIGLSSMGVNIAAVAVFTGAIGVGIGLGLQKIANNLLGGLILLLDKSIKPGDVVQVGSTFGVISRLQSRFVAVRTLDGIEHLIPNEILLSTTVVNWTYSDRLTQLKIKLNVLYGTDYRLALRLMAEAAAQTPRVLADPAPSGWLMHFGDARVELELGFWIADPENGVDNVSSEIRFKIWDVFKEHGINFLPPVFPLQVALQREPAQPGAGGDGKE